jgi:hypothetical protein
MGRIASKTSGKRRCSNDRPPLDRVRVGLRVRGRGSCGVGEGVMPDDPRQVAYAAARAVWMREERMEGMKDG